MSISCRNQITIISTDPHIIDTIVSLVKSVSVIHNKNKKGIQFEYMTRHEPDYTWLEDILDHYSCWIKNTWSIEKDTLMGIWIGSTLNSEKQIQSMQWNDFSM